MYLLNDACTKLDPVMYLSLFWRVCEGLEGHARREE